MKKQNSTKATNRPTRATMHGNAGQLLSGIVDAKHMASDVIRLLQSGVALADVVPSAQETRDKLEALELDANVILEDAEPASERRRAPDPADLETVADLIEEARDCAERLAGAGLALPDLSGDRTELGYGPRVMRFADLAHKLDMALEALEENTEGWSRRHGERTIDAAAEE